MKRLLGVLLTVIALVLGTAAIDTLSSPASATVLGKGNPPTRHFSGYVARNGAELGIARLADGTWGLCLDTGSTWKWPTTTPPSRPTTDPVAAYLTFTYLDRARRDPYLAAALWWAVGERLNSQPRKVRSHVRRMKRESPVIARRVTAWHRTLTSDAARNAPATGGYAMPAPGLSRSAITGVGARTRSGAWLAGKPVQITLTGATFEGGAATWSGQTPSGPLALAVQPSGPVPITAVVRITNVASTRFRLVTPKHRYRQRVAAALPPTTLQTRASVPFVPAKPRVVTRINQQRALTGATLVDRMTVTGLSTEPAAPAVRLEWSLWGPVRADATGTCRRASWRGAPRISHGAVAVRRDGTVTAGATRITQGGCYTYRERLLPTPYSFGTPWSAFGIAAETALIVPRSPNIPRHPEVASGGESSGNEPIDRSGGIAAVAIPSVKMKAPLFRVDFRGKRMTPPQAISSAGIWRRGAGVNDAVGTTVIVGHVSDNRDRPGAFHRLLRAKRGHTVTLNHAGRTTAWRVVSIRRVDRDRLPVAPFTQSVARRLVLITCSDRVTTRNGGFRYTKNLIIEAVPR